MITLKFEVQLTFDGEVDKGDVQNRLYGVIEAARRNSQLSNDFDSETGCDDVVVMQVDE